MRGVDAVLCGFVILERGAGCRWRVKSLRMSMLLVCWTPMWSTRGALFFHITERIRPAETYRDWWLAR